MNNNFKCPICKGTGNLPESYSHKKLKTIDKKVMAKLLSKEGYSIRQIMRFLEYKSPRSVHLILNSD